MKSIFFVGFKVIQPRAGEKFLVFTLMENYIHLASLNIDNQLSEAKCNIVKNDSTFVQNFCYLYLHQLGWHGLSLFATGLQTINNQTGEPM